MRLSPKDMARISIVTALAISTAMLTRFGSAVIPFSLLPIVALLAGGILGARNGAIAMSLYVLMGVVGLPVFATEPYGGVAYVLKPSFGFLLGFIACAWVTGQMRRYLYLSSTIKGNIIGALVGIMAMYVIGVGYLWIVMNFYVGKATGLLGALKMGLLPFILPDVVKAVVAGLVAHHTTRRLSEWGTKDVT